MADHSEVPLVVPVIKKNNNETKSKGVKRIMALLDGLGVDYRLEFTFRNCKDIRCLPFDIMVIVNGLVAVIEYDGKQHFELVSRFHGSDTRKAKEKLDKQRLHDLMKNRYCRDHHISLLRISYQEDDNIEKWVTEFITSLTKQSAPTPITIFSNHTLYSTPYGIEESWCQIM